MSDLSSDLSPALDRSAHSPLLAAIIARHGYAVVGEEDFEAAAAAHPLAMLLVAGDWWRLAECDDLAVVLPELDKALGGHVSVLIAAREAERAMQRRFRFATFPALIFLREGRYLGAMEGIRDWSDYMADLPEMLGREPADPPPFRMPAGCATPQGDA